MSETKTIQIKDIQELIGLIETDRVALCDDALELYLCKGDRHQPAPAEGAVDPWSPEDLLTFSKSVGAEDIDFQVKRFAALEPAINLLQVDLFCWAGQIVLASDYNDNVEDYAQWLLDNGFAVIDAPAVAPTFKVTGGSLNATARGWNVDDVIYCQAVMQHEKSATFKVVSLSASGFVDEIELVEGGAYFAGKGSMKGTGAGEELRLDVTMSN